MMQFCSAFAVAHSHHGIILKGSQHGLGRGVGIVSPLWHQAVQPMPCLGNPAAHLMFQQGCHQDGDHNQQDQACQTPGRMQPHGSNLDKTLDEVS